VGLNNNKEIQIKRVLWDKMTTKRYRYEEGSVGFNITKEI